MIQCERNIKHRCNNMYASNDSIMVINMEKSKPRKNVKALVKKGVAEEYGSVDTKPKVYVEPENKYSKKLEEKRIMKRLRDKTKAKEKPHLNKKMVAQKKAMKEGGLPEIEEEESIGPIQEEATEESDDTSPLVKEVEDELKHKLD